MGTTLTAGLGSSTNGSRGIQNDDFQKYQYVPREAHGKCPTCGRCRCCGDWDRYSRPLVTWSAGNTEGF